MGVQSVALEAWAWAVSGSTHGSPDTKRGNGSGLVLTVLSRDCSTPCYNPYKGPLVEGRTSQGIGSGRNGSGLRVFGAGFWGLGFAEGFMVPGQEC